MHPIVRSKHFIDYVENIFVRASQRATACTEQKARDNFKETFYDDFNMLSWIIDNIFPSTRRVGNTYEFITGELTHKELKGREGKIGQAIITVDDAVERIKFSSTFKHGHIRDDGSINCYGSYRPFYENVSRIGFSGALMELYNFSVVSGHDSIFPSEVTKHDAPF